MSGLNHVLLTNLELKGFAYGTLRDFEDEIIRITNAQQAVGASRNLPSFAARRLAHGTRYSGLRKLIPKVEYELKADVLWVILMGPENFNLDLFKNWDKQVGIKILYLFDTFESQLPSLRRVLNSTKWDFTITSFQEAVPYLENHTQRKWYVVPQGVKLERFQPAAEDERLISFCAYGRRQEETHQSVKEYCAQTGKYYDYSTSATVQAHLDPREYYGHYAWHLTHSIFNFCWAVEVTDPVRTRGFSPVTCRWFEAAASGNVIIGQAPKSSMFDELFGPNLVISIDHPGQDKNLRSTWEMLWDNRSRYLQAALQRRAELAHNWSWECRVLDILRISGTMG